MIKVGIIGAAGYTAGELIRILLNHPQTEIVFAHSTSNAHQPFWTVHEGLYGDTDACFSADYDLNSIDVLFLCSGHGKSSTFWADNHCPAGLKVIDLAQDYRDEHDSYVYGLPEWQRDRIANATRVANPGCFATAVQLALMPLAAHGMLHESISVTAVTGSTGSGQKPTETSHFSWRANNLSVYKPFVHQHLIEIQRNLSIVAGHDTKVTFTPVRGDFTRGILVMATVPFTESDERAKQIFSLFYQDAVFTHLFPETIDLKQVVNTNKCLVNVCVHEGQMLITSAIDNLLKGASGQAVQNMNLMFGLKEDMGLRLKASAF